MNQLPSSYLSECSGQLALSILSADFTRLGEQVKEVESLGGDCFHLDIMDGHFVSNISFGAGLVKQIRGLTEQCLDVHLMIADPDRYLNDFVQAGSNVISVHVEACTHLHRTLEEIKSLGCQAGVAINPATPLNAIEEVLPLVDQVLLMSVNPGFGGQKFIPSVLDKLIRLKKILEENALTKTIIEIDGGVNQDNIKSLIDRGATRLVVGSAVFNSKSTIKDNYTLLHSCLNLSS